MRAVYGMRDMIGEPAGTERKNKPERIEAPGKALQQQGATIADGLQQAVRTAYWHDRRRALLEREKRTAAAA